MAVPPIHLDEIAKVTTPGGTILHPTRSVIFDTHAVIFVAENGKAVPAHIIEVSEFNRSRHPRTQPHTLTDTSGDTWCFERGGCGCGNPVKKASWRMGLAAVEQYLANQHLRNSEVAGAG